MLGHSWWSLIWMQTEPIIPSRVRGMSEDAPQCTQPTKETLWFNHHVPDTYILMWDPPIQNTPPPPKHIVTSNLIPTHRNVQKQLPTQASKLDTQIALKPIYDPANTPTCKCGQKHNCFCDHIFKCKKLSKKVAHNIVHDSWVKALQPASSQAGYIWPSRQLEIEKKHIRTRDTSAQPFDESFDPDPTTTYGPHTYCPYSTISAQILLPP